MVSRDWGFLISALCKRLDIVEKILAEEKGMVKKEWLTKEEVLKMLRISPRTLQSYRDNGRLPFSQVGGKLYYKTSDIEDLLNQNYCKQ